MQNVIQLPSAKTSTIRKAPLEGAPVHVLEPASSTLKVKWDQGLPRTVNPHTEKDDTEERKAQCEQAYQVYPYTDESKVNALRRGLYMSILTMRESCVLGGRGYLLDKHVLRRSVRQPILQ